MKLKSQIIPLAQVLSFAVTMFLAPSAVSATKYKVLHTFGAGQDGSVPSGPLLIDGKGRLYGNTANGGTGKCSDYSCGITFELLPEDDGWWKEVIIHEFTGGKDGAIPTGNIIADPAGNLYSTLAGDVPGQAAVFELSHGSVGWKISLLYQPFVSPGLVLDHAGNLYGPLGPGKYSAGAIGGLSPGSHGWSYRQLYSFCHSSECLDGDEPYAPLIWDRSGNLYGTTLYGGNGPPKCPGNLGCGVVFQMVRDEHGGWTYRILHRFASSPNDGQNPVGGLVMDASGDLYGTTEGGGPSGDGTVFKLAFVNGNWQKTVLYAFPDCADGCIPGSTLVFDKKGNLYGAASGGNQGCGPDTCGTIFKLTRQKNDKWSYSVLHKFRGPDGNFPWGVVIDGKGNIFGTTESGGTYNAGVAFEIMP
jgi:uncharacterized repeat protein (TIGR03803 family)